MSAPDPVSAAPRPPVPEPFNGRRLLEAVAESSRALLAEDLETGLRGALQALLRGTGLDRVYVGRYAHEERAGYIYAEECRPGVTSFVATLGRGPFPFETFEEVWRPLMEGAVYSSPLAAKNGANAAIKSAAGTRSDLIVPIFVDGRFWGAVGFDDCSQGRPFWDAEVQMLKGVASAIAMAVSRDARLRQSVADREAMAGELVRANGVLRRAIAGVASLREIDEFLRNMLRESIAAAGADGGAVALIDGGDIVHRVLIGRDGEIGPDAIAARGLARVPVPSTLIEAMAAAEQAQVVTGLDPAGGLAPAAVQEFHRQEGTLSVTLVPLRAANRLLGWMGLGFNTRFTLTADKLALLRVLGDQVTLALELDRMATDERAALAAREQAAALERRAAFAEEINAVLRRSAARLALAGSSATLDAAVAEIGEVLRAACAHLFVCDPAREVLELRAAWRGGAAGERGARDEPAVFRRAITYAETPLLSRLCASRKLVSYARGELEGTAWEGVPAWFAREGFQDALVAAVMLGDRPLGVFTCAFREVVRPEDGREGMLQALTVQLALALEFSRLGSLARSHVVAEERAAAERSRALELARTNEAVRRSSDRLASDTDLSAYLCTLMGEAIALSGAKSAGVFTYTSRTQELRMTAFMTDGAEVRIDQDPRMTIWRRPVPTEITRRWVERLRTERFAWFDNSTAAPDHPWPSSLEWHRSFGHRYIITVPLHAGGEVIGAFGQCFVSDGWPAGFDYERTRLLAGHAALALQLARLGEEARTAATAGAVLAERNRIARDLHDTLAQGFTGVLAQLGAAEGAVEIGRAEEVARYLDRAKSLARFSLAEARASVHALRPEHTEQPLNERLSQMASAMTNGTSLLAQVTESGIVGRLSATADWCAHKFVQEALANAVKHSQARNLRVEIAWAPGSLTLTVSDDGVGFAPELIRPGLGLLVMAERAREAEGSLEHEGRPGEGTVLRLLLPLLPA